VSDGSDVRSEAQSAPPRVYSKRKGAEAPPPGSVYVGRPTIWGSPFVMQGERTRNHSIDCYRRWIMAPEQAPLRERARLELRGKDLVCWCAPKPCHADVLLEVANTSDITALPSDGEL
jgi:hypothetical protein